MTFPMSISVEMDDVRETSLDMLEMLEDDGIPTGVGAAAAALTLGRLIAPDVLTPQQEMDFLQLILEYTGTYFAGTGGQPN